MLWGRCCFGYHAMSAFLFTRFLLPHIFINRGVHVHVCIYKQKHFGSSLSTLTPIHLTFTVAVIVSSILQYLYQLHTSKDYMSRQGRLRWLLFGLFPFSMRYLNIRRFNSFIGSRRFCSIFPLAWRWWRVDLFEHVYQLAMTC